MFKQLLLAGSLVVSGVALHAPAASAAPLRAPVELDIGSAIQPVQYYYGPRRATSRPAIMCRRLITAVAIMAARIMPPGPITRRGPITA